MTYMQPPFWASNWSRATAPHAVSVLVVPPAVEPISVAEAKAAGRLPDGEDGLIRGWIAAARQQVETDTGLALLTQTRDVYVDAVTGAVITLPAQSRPLQAVTSVKTIDAAGVEQTLDPANYVVDLASARIGLAQGGAWPSSLRPFQPYVLRIVSGWASVELLQVAQPMLVHLVALLTAHYATVGRDLTTVGTIIAETPHGYEDAISPYRPVTVA